MIQLHERPRIASILYFLWIIFHMLLFVIIFHMVPQECGWSELQHTNRRDIAGQSAICGGAHISAGDFKSHCDGHNHRHRHRHPGPADFSRMSQNLENNFFYYFPKFKFSGKDIYQNIGSGEVIFNFFRSVVIFLLYFLQFFEK